MVVVWIRGDMFVVWVRGDMFVVWILGDMFGVWILGDMFGVWILGYIQIRPPCTINWTYLRSNSIKLMRIT